MNRHTHILRAYCRMRRGAGRIRRPVHRSATVSVVATCLLASPAALASIPAGMSFPHAAAPHFNWDEPMEISVSGVPVVLRGFVAGLSLDQAAKAMARHEKRFQRVTTLPGAVLLSGVHAGRHWVAQLEAAPGRVKGMVSTLPLDFVAAPQAPGKGSPASWLAQNARFVFAQSSSAGGQFVRQSIHLPERPLSSFMGDLSRHLAEGGWRRAGVHSWMGPTSGRPEGPRIDVFPVPASDGGRDAILVSEFQ